MNSHYSPLENQSYSNNPNGRMKEESILGRSNPILPQNIQNTLENMGILNDDDVVEDNGDADGNIDMNANTNTNNSPVRSSQAIDLKNQRVRNVVSFQAKSPIPFQPTRNTNHNDKNIFKGFLTVDVKFKPNPTDARKINVKFEACRLRIRDAPLALPFPVDLTVPLGIIGPTGWLRTGYIDDEIRITRGHKGSVFILKRTARKSRK
jgi:hypothetical protein